MTRRTAAGLMPFAGIALAGSHDSAPPAPKQRHFRIDFDVTIHKIPTLAEAVDLWVPIPHDDPYQSISRLNITGDDPAYKIYTGQFGNKMLFLRVAKPTHDTVQLNIQFDVKRREHLRISSGVNGREEKADQDPYFKRWLEPDRLVPLDAKVRGWAMEAVNAAGAKTDLEKARAIYNHIVATVKYDKTGQGWGRGDIYYACDARRGNCTDFHAIFIGYARSLGIPARFSIGLSLPLEHGQGTIAGYHCWAEFYIQGIGWIPVDASEAAKDPTRREYFFGAHDENRVEFSRGRDVTLNPKQHGDALNYFIFPYVEIDTKTFESVECRIHYLDLGKSPRPAHS